MIKQFNRKQVHWAEFLFEFNFKIKYCLNIQETKFDNLIRQSWNILFDLNDSRNQFQRQIIFKAHHVSKELCIFKNDIIKAVVLISLLQVHNINKITKLINVIYVHYDFFKKIWVKINVFNLVVARISVNRTRITIDD